MSSFTLIHLPKMSLPLTYLALSLSPMIVSSLMQLPSISVCLFQVLCVYVTEYVFMSYCYFFKKNLGLSLIASVYNKVSAELENIS